MEADRELRQLQQRIAVLEAARQRGRQRARRGVIAALAVAGLVGAVALVPTVYSQAACASVLPAPMVTLCPATPARAADVNGNFSTVIGWLEQKVGTAGSPSVEIAGGLSVQGSGTFSVGTDGKVRSDEGSSTYDVWLQGGSSTSGETRNLALLGLSETSGDRLIVNYGSEYQGGTEVQSDLNVTGRITGGEVAGCYTHWGVHGCANGYDEVVRGRTGGVESYPTGAGVHFANVECVSNSASVSNTWTDYYTRLMRANSDGNGMQNVRNDCSICCQRGCYTVLGSDACASGFSRVYRGRTGGIEAHNGQRPDGKTLCIDLGASASYTWSSGYDARLMRHRSPTGSDYAGMDEVTNSCAVCCR